MHITVQVRSVYGNELVYPADDQAVLFASLIGAKTFNARRSCAQYPRARLRGSRGCRSRKLPAGF